MTCLINAALVCRESGGGTQLPTKLQNASFSFETFALLARGIFASSQSWRQLRGGAHQITIAACPSTTRHAW
jgi:hypothetical protein